VLALGDRIFSLQLRSIGVQQFEKINRAFAIPQTGDIGESALCPKNLNRSLR
jgi:hypothetical protein